MAITENQRSVIRIVSVLSAAAIMWTSAFSVSAQTISDENSSSTETQVSEESDLVLPNGDTLTSDDGEIKITEGITVDIKVGNKAYKSYEVPRSTVNMALKHANIKLGKNDTVNTKLTSKVKENQKIKVTRVSYKTKTKTQKVKYKVVKKKTNKLYVGQTKVKVKGKYGKKKVTYTIKMVNGKAAKKFISKTKVTKKAASKVVLVGTKRRNYTMFENNPTTYKTKSKGGIGTIVDHRGKTIAYKQVISGMATAYSASPGALTSVGDSVHIGGIAVNPSVIPYGSKLYIQNADGSFVYGYAVANDTGGFAYNGSGTLCDLFYTTNSACCQFGRRSVNVYILA
ncbi:MAG: G5 domain-containing protein [Ruminococcus sp.]|nr:G5 domain-containing protein [Ruminococcus sp.]